MSIYRVYDVVHAIRNSLERNASLHNIMIKGEISNFTNHRSGHWYFTLKDEKARISAIMFASYASKAKFLPREGMKVIVTANVSMYEASGNVQLYVSSMTSDGLGDLYLQIEERKKKLAAEGLFDPKYKKQLPPYPMNIAIISAKTGAAIQDVLTTLANRWPLADVYVYEALVQGVKASEDVIDKLKIADENHHDVILIVRGGGSIEDLWCFHSEELARAVFAAKTPIVSGVGHESDITLIDYVSDFRAPTPTGAAQVAVPDIYEVYQQVKNLSNAMIQSMRRIDRNARTSLAKISSHPYLKDPTNYLKQYQMQVLMLHKSLSEYPKRIATQRIRLNQQITLLLQKQNHFHNNQMYQLKQYRTSLQNIMYDKITSQRHRLGSFIELLDAYSPLSVLKRGYAILMKEDEVIKSIDQVVKDDQIKIQLNDGFIYANITKKEDHDGTKEFSTVLTSPRNDRK